MSLSALRKPVDTFVPSLGRLYRRLRDAGVERQFRETVYGFKLAGDARMASADFESNEASAFLELLQGCDTVLDIGANIGFYSCLAASRGKHVIAFEPSRRNLDFFYENLWENKLTRVEVLPIGLGGECGLNRMYGFGGISSFVVGWAQAETAKYSLVPVATLDAVVAKRFEGKKLLIKMDVEGFELDVLAGATETLRLKPKPTWMVEILLRDGVIPGGTNTRFQEAFETFWKHAYECRKLDKGRAAVGSADVQHWASSGASGCKNFLFSSALNP
jgi:FkbM family methyltransferase